MGLTGLGALYGLFDLEQGSAGFNTGFAEAPAAGKSLVIVPFGPPTTDDPGDAFAHGVFISLYGRISLEHRTDVGEQLVDDRARRGILVVDNVARGPAIGGKIDVLSTEEVTLKIQNG